LQPNSLSSVKHQANVCFGKQLARNEKILYNGVSMSDSLFCSEMMNIIRPKPKGFLQFSNAAVDRFGIDRKQ